MHADMVGGHCDSMAPCLVLKFMQGPTIGNVVPQDTPATHATA